MLSDVVIELIDAALESHLPNVTDECARHEGLVFQRGLKSLLATLLETASPVNGPLRLSRPNIGGRIGEVITKERHQQVLDAGLAGQPKLL